MNDLPYASAEEHLWEELARVEHLVRAQVAAWSADLTAAGKPVGDWGLVHISPGQVTHYLEQGFAAPDQRATPDIPVATHRQAYDAAGHRARRRRAATPGIEQFRLRHLEAAFDLVDLDLDLLLLTLLPEVDPRYRLVYGYLRNDAARCVPTVELLTDLVVHVDRGRTGVPARLAPGAPLRAGRLLRVNDDEAAGPPGRRGVTVDERIVRFVLGDDGAGDGPMRHVAATPAGSWDDYLAPAHRLEQLSALTRWCAGRVGNEPTVLVLEGARGSGRSAAARAVATGAGVPLLAADVSGLRTAADPWPDALDLVYREARLRGAALLWTGADTLFDGGEPTRELADLLHRAEAFAGLTLLVTVERWEPAGRSSGTPVLRVPFAEPDHDTRVRLWARYLPGVEEFAPPGPERADLANALATGYQLTPGQIVDAVRTARAAARVREPGRGLLVPEDLAEGCRVQSGRRLTQLAQRIEPRPGLDIDDLVLAPPNRRQLDELRSRIALRDRLARSGFDGRLPGARSLLVLFTGASGTGKTKGAELLAAERGVDLYKIDLSEVVSKYIGETEKNLRRVFREAEDANAILFFDEADALFGKRGEVREARDRWANIEVNFLLQGVEQFDGIVVLATNLRQNIDEAFLRRIHLVVEFPFPDATARLRIWQRMFPPAELLGRPGDDQLRELAERFPIPGGSIRNVVIDAAVRALAVGGDPPTVTLRQLAASLARDYQKLGRPLTAVEFGAELYPWVEEDVLLSRHAGT